MKRNIRYGVFLFLLLFFCSIWIPELSDLSKSSRLSADTVTDALFRRQPVNDRVSGLIRSMESPGEYLAVYWLETGFGEHDRRIAPEDIVLLRQRWERAEGWSDYLGACQAVWDDLVYFPVALSREISVSFEDSWMYDRTYKEERGHEGTDIMPDRNERGILPVVSMTDGTVEKKGWLELGGYRVGIRASGGAYFYYAHLDSYADIEEGDEIKAGDLLGYMGDTGYGAKEGTKGKFPVHLHLGIYISHEGEEISVNPYPALKYVEEKIIDYQER